MERQRHKERKYQKPVSLTALILLMAVLAACSPETTPMPADATMQAGFVRDQATARAIITEDAGRFKTAHPLWTPTSTPPPRPKDKSTVCGTVAEGGSAEQALRSASKTHDLPPARDGWGNETQVQIDHKQAGVMPAVRLMMTLGQMLGSAPIVAPGDRVCAGWDTGVLQLQPTLTPGPYLTPTPARQGNLNSRSFAVAVNRPVLRRP